MPKKVYQAGPLFTEAERLWHLKLKTNLEDSGFLVSWPGEWFDPGELGDMGKKAKDHIFKVCRANLDTSDLVVALLDGTQVDDGTAWEIGYAFSKGIPVYGIRTDFRNAGDTEHSLVNAMIECACEEVVGSVAELLDRLKLVQAKKAEATQLH
jgi:nucleoside 2-deoxyribosyltransferase